MPNNLGLPDEVYAALKMEMDKPLPPNALRPAPEVPPPPPTLTPEQQAAQNLQWQQEMERRAQISQTHQGAPLPPADAPTAAPVGSFEELYGKPSVGVIPDLVRIPAPTDTGEIPPPPPPKALDPSTLEIYKGAKGTQGAQGKAGSVPWYLRASSSKTGALQGSIEDLDAQQKALEAQQAAIEAPYSTPDLMTDSEGKLVDVSEPGGSEAEIEAIRSKTVKSDADLARLQELTTQQAIDTAAEKTQEQLAVQDAIDQQIADHNAEKLAAAEAYQKAAQEETAKLDSMMADYATKRVDPNRLLGTAGKRVGAALAVALGSLGSSLAGGPNSALQIINGAIDRDISAQKQDIAKAGQAVGMQKGLLAQMRQQFGDEESARLAAKEVMLNAAQSRLKRIDLTFAPKEKIDAAAALTAQLDQAREEARREREAKMIDRLHRSSLAEGQLGATKEKTDMAARAMAARAAASSQKPEPRAPLGLRLIDPTRPIDKKDEKFAQETYSDYRKANTLINKAIEWRKEYGAEALDRDAINRGKVLFNDLKIARKITAGMGAALSPNEEALLSMDGDINDAGWVLSTLEQIRNTMTGAVRDGLYTYNYDLDSEAAKQQGTKVEQ